MPRQFMPSPSVLSLPKRTDSNQHLTVPPSRHALSLLRSCLTPLLSLMFFAGLAGCGPAATDKPQNLESRANMGRPSLSSQGPPPGNNSSNPATQVASPVPLASVNGTGSASENGTVPAGDKLPVPGIPESIAKGLESLYVRDRIQALDHWEKKGATPPLDPVFEALEDEDEAVRAKATAIVEKYWAAEQEREKG